ncbi:MAG: helix-turn-helix domain-containing protein [Clostridia bacterium]
MSCVQSKRVERLVLTENEIGVAGVSLLGYNRNLFAQRAISPHCHVNAIEIVYVESGGISFLVNKQRFNLRGGDCLMTPPNVEHSTGSAPTGVCEFYWFELQIAQPGLLCLEENARQELLKALLEMQPRVIHCARHWGGMFSQLMKLPAGTLSHPHLTLVSTLLPFLCDLLSQQKACASYSADIADALCYIQAHLCEDILLEELSSVAGLSLAWFKRKFKQEIGVSPREYINAQKVELAKATLLDERSVTHTAFELGFSSSDYFSFIFHKFTGLTPTQHIKRFSPDSYHQKEVLPYDEGLARIAHA